MPAVLRIRLRLILGHQHPRNPLTICWIQWKCLRHRHRVITIHRMGCRIHHLAVLQMITPANCERPKVRVLRLVWISRMMTAPTAWAARLNRISVDCAGKRMRGRAHWKRISEHILVKGHTGRRLWLTNTIFHDLFRFYLIRFFSGYLKIRCPDCNKAFSQMANLTAHVRTHVSTHTLLLSQTYLKHCWINKI